MKVLVTGANGFVGRAILDYLVRQPGLKILAVARRMFSDLPKGVELRIVSSLSSSAEWPSVLSGVQVVIHSAARVHILQGAKGQSLPAFRAVNVNGTMNLARQASRAGVRRFIFISSIKVNGEGKPSGRPYTAGDEPSPQDPYGVSKREAEEKLRELEQETGMEVVILRPPLVYGPEVKANFLNLMKLVDTGIPLPFASLSNKRSLIFIGNLVDVILKCLGHINAAGKTFLVSDCDDLSTPELIRRIAKAMGKPARLFPFPPGLFSATEKLPCGFHSLSKITGSLTVDSSKTMEQLEWKPPWSVDHGFMETVAWYRKTVSERTSR